MAKGNKFKGEDRLLLKKLRLVIKLIKRRDQIAAGTTPTAAISNRLPMITLLPTVPPDPLSAAIDLIDARAATLLAAKW